MDKFRNKYRIPSSRWQNWDYGSNAAYYVTICTQHHVCYFGDIVLAPEKTMQFNEMGSIALHYWCDIPTHFPFVELDAFVIMPNHVHGIVLINKTGGDDPINPGMNIDNGSPVVETRLIASLQSSHQSISRFRGGITGNKNPMIHENLSRVIRWFKGRCSFEIHKIAGDFTWQSRFHDRVIRDHNEYCAIKDYIDNNIEKWEMDSLHKSFTL